MDQDKFSSRLLHWFDQHGRHTLPWQLKKTLYRVWVSEVMLQQTQVTTVIPYYQRFMVRFPDIKTLANASEDDVLAHWAGLGYYARGRNLHKAAGLILAEYEGQFPDQFEAVNALPGIGRSTAGAILSLALDQRHAILDGNVKRSLCRYHGIKTYPGEKSTEAKLWELAEHHTPHSRHADYTQAIMDMGAMLCTRSKPDCPSCPHQSECVAFKQDEITNIPCSRPKKPKPRKHRTLLALIDDKQQLSLFKRPSEGIWGGLYALPEFESTQVCLALLRAAGIDIENQTRQSAQIKHSFTHFELSIHPIICHTSATQQQSIKTQLSSTQALGILTDKQTTYPLSSDQPKLRMGIPAPIQKLIGQIKAAL